MKTNLLLSKKLAGRTLAGLALGLLAAPALAQLPPPPPPPPGNAPTAAKVRLGKVLFWDEQLSSSRTMSCGTCHIPRTAGGDPRSASSPLAINPGTDGVYGNADDIFGSPGVPLADASGFYMMTTHFGLGPQATTRRTNSAINSAYPRELFWDGRAAEAYTDPVTNQPVAGLQNGAALESQAMGPPASEVEMGHRNRVWTDILTRIAGSEPLALATDAPIPLVLWINGRTYQQLFTEAYGDASITAPRVAMAIASYERTLFTDQSPFDAWLAGDDTALTAQELAGRGVFSQASCDRCHSNALMSDNIFHYIGLRPASDDEGRFTVTGQAPDRGRMRTPSLRNVEKRSPYMHNGRFATLEEVVEFYNRGGDFDAPNKDPLVRPLNLTPQEKADLVAFLKRPLTDTRVVREDFPFDRPKLYSESGRVPTSDGSGQAGSGGLVPQAIAVEPALLGNTITFGVQNALGGAPALLVIDDVDPGLTPPVSADFAFETLASLAGSGNGAGYGSLRITVPNDAALVDKTFTGRWYITDGSGVGGVAVSKPFHFKVFPSLKSATVYMDNFETGNTTRWSQTQQ